MACVRMDKLDSSAYEAAFHSIFTDTKKNHPEFDVGKTLKGIVADWSDTQMNGLKLAIGETKANKVVKGCQVFFHTKLSYNKYSFSIRYITNAL